MVSGWAEIPTSALEPFGAISNQDLQKAQSFAVDVASLQMLQHERFRDWSATRVRRLKQPRQSPGTGVPVAWRES